MVNGAKFEIYNIFNTLPPHLIFTGMFGTGPMWTVPQVLNSDGQPTRVMWDYQFEGTEATLAGSFLDLFVPGYVYLHLTLHLVQAA